MKKILSLGFCLLAAYAGNSQTSLSCEGQEYKVDGNKVIWMKNGADWTHIGDRCVNLSCERRRVFCKSTDGFVWRYNGTPNNWTRANTLLAGQSLNAGTLEMGGAHFLRSDDGKNLFYMQEDGNLGIWKHDPTAQNTWNSNTAPRQNCTLMMQPDGNLVAYDKDKQVVWSSQTQTTWDAKYGQEKYKPTKLVMENSGRAVLYSATGFKVWDNVNGKYALN